MSMRIVLLTQDDPFYLAKGIDYLIANLPEGAEMVGAVVFDVSPFGKAGSFKDKAKKTYEVFGKRFFAHYGVRYLKSKLAPGNSVKKVLTKHGVPLVQIDGRVNRPENRAKIAALKPDLLLSIGGNQIFRRPLLDVATHGCLNLHTALLPKYRGLMPTFWVLRNNEPETGVSVFFVDEGIDSGPILVQKRVEIGDRSQAELIKHTKKIGMDAILEGVTLIMKGGYQLIDNPEDDKTYFSFPTRADVDEFYRQGKRFF